jgi:hypothetical protein
MLRGVVKTCAIAGCFSFAMAGARAQEVIHAFAGTLSAVDTRPGKITMTVAASDNSQGIFKYLANSTSTAALDKKMGAGTVPPDTPLKIGTYVIVYYFSSNGKVRTPIALRDLGPGPFFENSGTIVKIENKHSVLVQCKSGLQSFKIGPDTVAETTLGVVEGYNFKPEKGDEVRVTTTDADGTNPLLFIMNDQKLAD